jgi:hypothetical protein
LSDQGEVLVLGAGFSRAVAASMPLTDELGDRSIDRAGATQDPRVPKSGFVAGRFETWLSRIAEEQPDLDEARNLENRALFLRVAAAMGDVLTSVEEDIASRPPPVWLARLIRAALPQGTPLITFNYDTLVEYAVERCSSWSHQHGARPRWYDLLGELPPEVVVAGSWALTPFPGPTIELLKLHGSINWYWSPGDLTGATIQRGRNLRYGAERLEDSWLRRASTGREPFLVPPTATKTGYYGNPLTRAMWRKAADRLHAARSIALLGYSAPVTDTVVGGMLFDALAASEAPIKIVNLEPGPVKDRLVQLGLEEDRIEECGGVAPIEQFADEFVARQSRRIRTRLSSEAPDVDRPVVVASSISEVAPVTGVDNSGQLATAAPRRVGLPPDGRRPLSLHELRRALLELPPDRVIRATVRGVAGSIIDAEVHSQPLHAGDHEDALVLHLDVPQPGEAEAD